MELHAAFIYFLLLANFLSVSAKIAGGPRGRFDNQPPKKTTSHVSAHHTQYAYHPPTFVHFICRHCTSVGIYPVYHGRPPTYVYRYRESGTIFGGLMTGLALYNLGRSQQYWNHTHYYTKRDDEQCSMQVIDRAHFDEVAFPCFMMSTFLEQPVIKGAEEDTFDIIDAQVNIKPYLNATGTPIQVTRAQDCVVWHNTTKNKEKKIFPCALLREYSASMKPAGVPAYIWLPTTLGVVIAVMVCIHTSCGKPINYKEEFLAQGIAEGYLVNYN